MKTLWGRKLIPVWKKFRSFGRLPLYWGVILVGERQKLTVIRLLFRLQDNLLGNMEKLDGVHWGLIVRNFGSAEDWESEVLTPLGILRV